MNRVSVNAFAGALLISSVVAVPATAAAASKHPTRSACAPSSLVLHAAPTVVPGLSSEQVTNAVAIINAAAALRVPQRGQTIAVMTALQTSSLKGASSPGRASSGGTPSPSAPSTSPAATVSSGAGLFGTGADQVAGGDPTTVAQVFYRALTRVSGWQNLPATLAAHAAQRNLDPQAYAPSWPRAVEIVDKLTTGTGLAGLRNLAARAQQVAECEAATMRGRFAINGGTPFVGQFAPAALDSRALDFAKFGGNGWFDRCQSFVAQLAGRPFSGYRTALDAWQTFVATGAAHPVTAADGVSPPVGAWLYYQSATNAAGHVVTYLGNGQIASTDVFGHGRVGIGPASAITDGPWHLQYLGWSAPWGQQ